MPFLCRLHADAHLLAVASSSELRQACCPVCSLLQLLLRPHSLLCLWTPLGTRAALCLTTNVLTKFILHRPWMLLHQLPAVYKTHYLLHTRPLMINLLGPQQASHLS